MNDHSAKNSSKSLVILTATDGMAMKFLLETILLLKVDRFEGLLNHCKIDRMVNDNSSSCS